MESATNSGLVADDSGLICGYLFEPLRPAQPIGLSEAARLLAEPGDDDSFVWLHFSLAHTGSLPWLQRHAGLSDNFYEALKAGLYSTRIERDDDALVAVINDVNFDFSFEPTDISTLWIAVSPKLVVTARRQPLRSIDQLRTHVKQGEQLRSTVELLQRLLLAQADALVDIVRSTTSRVDDIEDDLLAGRLVEKRARLGSLRRLLVRLQRLLAPEPAALFRLLQHPPAWTDETDVQELRQSTEEFSVVLRDMSALQERIKLLQEEIAAGVNEDNNRSLFVLTIVTVLALPINILAGLFGMNVGGVPLSQHPHGFWIVVLMVTTITGVAGWWAFRGKRPK
jgi:zinc transporter